MLGSLACHYITQQIRLKNSFPYSLHLPKHSIQWSLCQKYTHYLFSLQFTYLVIQMLSPPHLHPLLNSSPPLDVLVHLAAGWRLQASLGTSGSPLCGTKPDTCEPWQSYWFTVAVSRLLCQTKQQHNIFPLTVSQQFPTPKWLQRTFPPALKVVAALSAIICYCKLNTASEIVFVSPCQRVLIISECQGCLLGPPHFSQSQTHFLCCVTSSPIVKAYS